MSIGIYYLASPYSHPDPLVRLERYWSAVQAVAAMTKAGHIVYSPIAHFHPAASTYDLPYYAANWERINRAFADRCDALAVLTIDGHFESKGMRQEVEWFRARGIEPEAFTPSMLRFNAFEPGVYIEFRSAEQMDGDVVSGRRGDS